MKKLKQLKLQVALDRLILLAASMVLSIAELSKGILNTIFIGAAITLGVILLIRSIIYSLKQKGGGSTDEARKQEVLDLLVNLAAQMTVELNPNKPLEISSKFTGAGSTIRLFFSNYRIRLGGRIYVGCRLLSDFDNVAVNGVLAHELAHIKKKHYITDLVLIYSFIIPPMIYYFILRPGPIIPYFLYLAVGILVFSFISWHQEYAADAIAAEFVKVNNMTYALNQTAGFMYRPGDTLLHPSFKKRITRLH